MKNLSQLLIATMFVAVFGLVSCNKDNAESDKAREDLTASEQPAASTENPSFNATSNQLASNTTNAAGANQAQTPPPPPAPVGPATEMTFSENSHDFGTIEAGEKVSHKFTFTNTGDEPLTITNAKGSCGCTVPEWPREAIAPGGEGEILVTFDSKGKKGKTSKNVTIDANVPGGKKMLTISATINQAEAVQ